MEEDTRDSKAERARLLDWYCTPEDLRPSDEKDLRAFAKKSDFAFSTLEKWTFEKPFLQSANRLLSKRNMDPLRIQKVMENMYRIASSEGGQMAISAASLYMKLVEDMRPADEKPVDIPADFTMMSDEELHEIAFGQPRTHSTSEAILEAVSSNDDIDLDAVSFEEEPELADHS